MSIIIDDYIGKEYRRIYENNWKFMNKDYIYTADNEYHRKNTKYK